jgi:hypothetical protein
MALSPFGMRRAAKDGERSPKAAKQLLCLSPSELEAVLSEMVLAEEPYYAERFVPSSTTAGDFSTLFGASKSGEPAAA